MVDSMRTVLSFWVDREAGVHVRRCTRPRLYFNSIDLGRRGRPKFLLPFSTLTFLRELHFSWSKIASILGISRRTLFSIRQELGFEAIDPAACSLISDVALKQCIEDIKLTMPESGIRMIR